MDKNKLSRQCKILLDLFEDGYWHSGGEIYEQTKVIKYSTRISDLRLIHKRHIIKYYRDKQWWYKLLPDKNDIKVFKNKENIKCNPYEITTPIRNKTEIIISENNLKLI